MGLTPEVQGTLVAGIMSVVNIVLRVYDERGCAMKYFAPFLVLLVIGCTGTTETRAINAFAIACDSYASTLSTLSGLP